MKTLLTAAAALSPPVISVVADAVTGGAPATFETTLLGQGVLGAVLFWFMWINQRHREAQAKEFTSIAGTISSNTISLGEKIGKNGERIDRLSKVILIQTMSHPNFPEAAQESATGILREIEKDVP